MAKIIGKDALQGSSTSGEALTLKGRPSDNRSEIDFKSNNEATTYASLIGSSSGLGLDLPDTADSYSFRVNNIERVNINNVSTNIVGRLDGNSPPAGCVGEFKTGNIPVTGPAPTGVSGLTWDVSTGFSISAGTWLVTAWPTLSERNGIGFNFTGIASLRTSDGTIWSSQQIEGNVSNQVTVSLSAIVTVSTTVNVNLRFYFPSTSALLIWTWTDVWGNNARIQAVRIA